MSVGLAILNQKELDWSEAKGQFRFFTAIELVVWGLRGTRAHNGPKPRFVPI